MGRARRDWTTLLVSRWRPHRPARARPRRGRRGGERADEIDKLICGLDRAALRWPKRSAHCALAGWPRRRSRHPPALLSDPQLLARGFWETVDHPVAGSFLCTGMPFTFVGKPRRWIRRLPPLYGQHTDEVLTDVLGHSRTGSAALRESGATSARPAGL